MWACLVLLSSNALAAPKNQDKHTLVTQIVVVFML